VNFQYQILFILALVIISFYLVKRYYSKITTDNPEKKLTPLKISKDIIERDLNSHRSKSAKPMLWISMISMAMLFAGFTSAIIVSKGGNENWIYFDIPIWFHISTIVIVISSFSMHLAKKFVENTIDKLIKINGTKTVDYFHKKLGKIIWNNCGMSRNSIDLKSAIKKIQKLKKQFYTDLLIPGDQFSFNEPLAKALRVADFMELGELFALDALKRNESCGGHFREEFQTKEGEALRNDDEYAFVSAWEYDKIIENSILHKEKLTFNNVELKNRSYK